MFRYFFNKGQSTVEVPAESVSIDDFRDGQSITVFNDLTPMGVAYSFEQFNQFMNTSRADILSPMPTPTPRVPNYELAGEDEAPKNDHINPDHYKDYLVITGGDLQSAVALQWMETQQFKPVFRANPKAFIAAVLMQADKYLSRMGQKDDETQEMLKSLWYTKFVAAFMKNGCKPIRVSEINGILGDGDDYTLLLRFIKVINIDGNLEDGLRNVFSPSEIQRLKEIKNG